MSEDSKNSKITEDLKAALAAARAEKARLEAELQALRLELKERRRALKKVIVTGLSKDTVVGDNDEAKRLAKFSLRRSGK